MIRRLVDVAAVIGVCVLVALSLRLGDFLFTHAHLTGAHS